MAKYVLNTGNEDLDFKLLGLVCPDDQYQVVSLVNDALKTNLCLSEYVPYNLKDGRLFKFSLYHFMDEELGIDYFFIPNTSNFDEPNIHAAGGGDNLFADLGLDIEESVKLVKELPRTDYFLILKGEELHVYYHRIIEVLKTIPEVMQVQVIEPGDLPSRRNLIF